MADNGKVYERLDSYIDDRTTLDFSARYSMGDRFTVFVEGENLTDEPLRHYIGARSRLGSAEFEPLEPAPGTYVKHRIA